MWQGSTFGLAITVKDANNAVQNLSSYTARMQIRKDYTSGSATEKDWEDFFAMQEDLDNLFDR